jgi:hypothetical protein
MAAFTGGATVVDEATRAVVGRAEGVDATRLAAIQIAIIIIMIANVAFSGDAQVADDVTCDGGERVGNVQRGTLAHRAC